MSIKNGEIKLPLGSIVMLEGIPRLVCVMGHDVNAQNSGEAFEYAGVFFPEGYTDPSKCCMFNESHIDKVYSFGLLDELKDREPSEVNAINLEGMLPVGSVVRLAGGNLYIMIIGVAMRTAETGDRVFDYGAVLFPQGFMDHDKIYVFDQEQIEEILHVGFIYDGQREFEEKIMKLLSEER